MTAASNVKKRAVSLLKKVVPRQTRNLVMGKLNRFRLNRQLARREMPLRYLFVLSPMRAGSSLLGHVLTSNPGIIGYGENHVPYNCPSDLRELAYRTAHVQKDLDLSQKEYVMDKLVWNYPMADAVLRNKEARFIFLFRDPADLFNSAAGLGAVSSSHKKYQTPSVWMDYYRERLKVLQQQAVRVNDRGRCLILRYEDLLEKTESVLKQLQEFLGTAAPFSENYTTTERTGSLQYGDPSSNLRSGRILHGGQSAPRRFNLPAELEEEALRLQDECLAGVRRY